jgi:glycosyltransferase involved in cell wall biosynthesis
MMEEAKVKPVVSVVIPIYNTARYLCQCVDSVLNQTYDSLQVILVDDGSPDECPRLVDGYAGAKARQGVSVLGIHQENMGLSGARNTGLDRASGDYVVFLDSDDFLESDFIEVLVNAAVEGQLDMVVTPTRNVSHEGIFVNDEDKDDYWRSFDGSPALIRYNVTPRMYRTDFLRDNGLRFSQGELMEDVVFCLAANLLAKSWRLLDYHGYCYRLNPDGIVGGFKKNGIPDGRIPYRGLEASVKQVLGITDDQASGKRQRLILEYCTVRIVVTILFVFCRKSDIATVRHMCEYTRKLLGRYFPDFVHNPYFNAWHEENVPRFQSMSTWLFGWLYRTHLLKPFAYVYTRL